jgi:hypothetical protein
VNGGTGPQIDELAVPSSTPAKMAFYEKGIPFEAKVINGSEPVASEFAALGPIARASTIAFVFEATDIIVGARWRCTGRPLYERQRREACFLHRKHYGRGSGPTLHGARQPDAVTVFFHRSDSAYHSPGFKKIDRSMLIVAETEQIADRRNSLLKSRVQIFDGSGRRFFTVRRKNLR